MIDGMVERFAQETNTPCKIIATGGLAPQIIRSCKHEIVYDENIILEGLRGIYWRNKR